MCNPLDGDDLNKKNIVISANIPTDYYTKTYIDTTYYDKATIDTMIIPEPDLSAYMTAADIQNNYYDKITVDSMLIDGYTRTESDNKFVSKAGNASISGNLFDIGQNEAQSRVRTHFNHAGSTGYMEIERRYRDQGFLNFKSSYHYCEIF